MKEIRLEIPLECWKNLSYDRIWLKCVEDHTEAYEDMNFEFPIQRQKSAIVYVNVPENLTMIEVKASQKIRPTEQISLEWTEKQKKPDWRATGIRKAKLITEKMESEISIIAERLDLRELSSFSNVAYLDIANWAMQVSTFEEESIATFYWNSYFENESRDKVQNIYLSKGKPCIWEKGSLAGQKGRATIVCSKNGGRKKALYIDKETKNAPIPIEVGDVIVKVSINCRKGEINIWLLQIQEIKKEFKEAKAECIASSYDNNGVPYTKLDIIMLRNYIAEFSYVQWQGEEIAKKYRTAVLAAFDRATRFNVEWPYFIEKQK